MRLLSGDGAERLRVSALKVNVSAPSIYLNGMIVGANRVSVQAAAGVNLNGLRVSDMGGFETSGAGSVGFLSVRGGGGGGGGGKSSSSFGGGVDEGAKKMASAAKAALPMGTSAQFEGRDGRGVVQMVAHGSKGRQANSLVMTSLNDAVGRDGQQHWVFSQRGPGEEGSGAGGLAIGARTGVEGCRERRWKLPWRGGGGVGRRRRRRRRRRSSSTAAAASASRASVLPRRR